MMKRQHGFTLIELMITVAIIAILARIAYPSYLSQVRRSNRAEARTALLQTQVAQEKFFLQYSRYAGNSAGTSVELSNLPSDTTPGLGILATTIPKGSYTIVLKRPTTTTYNVTATYAGGQTGDTGCKTFVIDQVGNQSSTDSTDATNSAAANTVCWK